jgi:hypothetical protein
MTANVNYNLTLIRKKRMRKGGMLVVVVRIRLRFCGAAPKTHKKKAEILLHLLRRR